MTKVTIFIPDKMNELNIGIHGIARQLSENYTIDSYPRTGRWIDASGKAHHDRIYCCVIYTDYPDQIIDKIPLIRQQLKEQCIAIEVQEVEFRLI